MAEMSDDHKADRVVMQRIMQVLGPTCESDLPDGLAWEVNEALTLLRSRGIEYKSRSIERREALMKKS